jgi:hypothetical protein
MIREQGSDKSASPDGCRQVPQHQEEQDRVGSV